MSSLSAALWARLPIELRHRLEFQRAFKDAATELTDRERTLVSYRFYDGLSIDEIAVLYRVHRATIARSLTAIRDKLFEATRTRLVQRRAISEARS